MQIPGKRCSKTLTKLLNSHCPPAHMEPRVTANSIRTAADTWAQRRILKRARMLAVILDCLRPKPAVYYTWTYNARSQSEVLRRKKVEIREDSLSGALSIGISRITSKCRIARAAKGIHSVNEAAHNAVVRIR